MSGCHQEVTFLLREFGRFQIYVAQFKIQNFKLIFLKKSHIVKLQFLNQNIYLENN